jgi:choline dehydrogenase
MTTSTHFEERVRASQARLSAALKPHYDFIVCGAGSSGSVVARRLAENPEISVLLLEAGGSDDVPSVREPDQWMLNLGSERDWNFPSEPNPRINGRTIPVNMGKVLGGGSSINVMVWSRGHKNDWDFFAAEAGDAAWGYEAVLGIYRRIEDWHGGPDPKYRGTGGPVFVQPAPDPNPIAPAMVEGARSVGIPTFDSPNGRMMEGAGGGAINDLRVRDGKRQSAFRSYTFPYMDRPNLTVLTHALVAKVIFDGRRATGVEIIHDGAPRRIGARLEIVLSLGAVGTPKVLMQSGIGDATALERFSIPVIQHLPGVGQNFQDHLAFGCVWEYETPLPIHNGGSEATFFWKSDARLAGSDLQTCQAEAALCSAETAARFHPPPGSWTLFGGVVQPRSRGRVRLTGARPADPLRIETNFLSHPDDMKAALACLEICRDIGNSTAMRPYAKREVMPGPLKGVERENFIRDAALSYFHQTGTAKMGLDPLAVVSGDLEVYGVTGLRVADGSITPRITTGNTMAPCVIIGERASEILKKRHGI